MASPEGDLALTVKELSNVYEELTLLYRMSEVFSFLSIDEICLRMAEEAVNSIGVEMSAVLIADEGNQNLHTKAFRGCWDDKRVFPRDEGVIWKAIDSKKPSAFCALAETEHQAYFPGLTSLMVCPILGKARVMGALVVSGKGSGEEFLSSDSKLLMAITSQAGLAIENALLYKELESLLVGAIKALVKALEASSCWTAGHTERVTEYALAIGRTLGVNADLLERLKISALLHDIGKIATPKEILNKNDALDEEEWREIKRHPLLGAEILVELQQFEDIILSIKYHHEHWDGRNGLFKLKHGEIPLMARILSVADAFDAMTSDRPYRSMMTRDDAVSEIVSCSGTQFDPAVVDAFLIWIKGSGPTPQHQVS